tara:strand:- start:401 stop:976 length:576 start_codon:yes stop_codon:yes gene_type:complete
MEITYDLLGKWEPKVQRFLRTSFVLGMDKEDLGQELRLAILKAAQGFDETRGTSFHTYLHTSMVNTLRTLITKAQKQKDLHTASSIDGTYYNPTESDDQPLIPQRIQKALEDPTPSTKYSEIEIQDLLIRSNLNKSEINFVNLRIEGLTMAEITQELNESAYKLRHTVKRKLGRYMTHINWLGEEDADEED